MINYLSLQLAGQLPKPGKTGLDWYLFYKLAKQFTNLPMLECGTGYGGSALKLFQLTDKLTVIDDWCQGYSQQPFEQIIEKFNLSIKTSFALPANSRPKVSVCPILVV